MSLHKKILVMRYKNFPWYNFYNQLWFNYHHLFFCSLIFRGRKIFAFNLLLRIKEGLKAKEKYDPFLVFLVAFMKITPAVILLTLPQGGMLHSVPFPITPKKQVTFAVKWAIKLLKDSFRIVKLSTLVDNLVSALYNKGISWRKKKEIHMVSLKSRHLIKYIK